jgi:hypothetical protein
LVACCAYSGNRYRITHGVIPVGHAVRALLTDGEDDAHIAELAHGLTYWAARWQTLPAGPAAVGEVNATTPRELLAAVPRVAERPH